MVANVESIEVTQSEAGHSDDIASIGEEVRQPVF
jgi:hypothetical protein